MSEFLDRRNFDMRKILSDLGEEGVTCVNGAIRTDSMPGLTDEARRLPIRIEKGFGIFSKASWMNRLKVVRYETQGLITEQLLEVGESPFQTHLNFNEMVVDVYQGVKRVEPHPDDPWWLNLIAIFTLEGEARFGVCSDESKANAFEFDVFPGTLVLMRARGFRESIAQVWHYIDNISNPRYIFALRQSPWSL